MNLVTTCPQCRTAFIVKPEQLAAHRGDVRCGHCQYVFNALEHLSEANTATEGAVEEVASQDLISLPEADAIEPHLGEEATSPVSVAEDTPPPEEPTEQPDDDAPLDASMADDTALDQAALSAIAAQPLDFELEAPSEDPTDTIEAPADEASLSQDNPEPSAEENAYPSLIDPDLLDAPTAEPEPEPTPSMVRAEAGIRQRPSFLEQKPAKSRRWGWLASLMALVLLLLMAAQLAYFFRTELSVRIPQVKPLLERACAHLGCKIALPRHIELISIDDSELLEDETHQEVVRLTTTLINQAPYAQAYPDLELTLTDMEDHAVLRRTFAPVEYLPATTAIAQGIAAGGEVHVKLAITTGELKAAGYRVYITYP